MLQGTEGDSVNDCASSAAPLGSRHGFPGLAGDLLVMFRLWLTRLEIETYLIWTRVAPSLATGGPPRAHTHSGAFLEPPLPPLQDYSTYLGTVQWESALDVPNNVVSSPQ